MQENRCTQNYISLQQFCKIARKKEKTIIKHYKEIPIIIKDKKEYKVLIGTRYPCKIKSYKIIDDIDRRYVLLKSISDYKYIDCYMLNVYQNTFCNYLKDFISAGLIRENNNGNSFGANAYDCTELGGTIVKKEKQKAKKEIVYELSHIAGAFVGEIISCIMPENGVA